MNQFRTFTMAHNRAPVVIRADAIDAFHAARDGGTTIYLRGAPHEEAFMIVEDFNKVRQMLESEMHT